MGNLFVHCKLSKPFCNGGVGAKQSRVLQVVRTDGKMLEFTSPRPVKDVLVNFSGLFIGVSKEASEQLPPNYELKMGKVYYMLPVNSQDVSSNDTNSVKRIKIVITKQQLQDLLTRNMSVEEMLEGLEKRSASCSVDCSTNWRPKLEAIPEESE